MACKNCEEFKIVADRESGRAETLQRMLEGERAKPTVEALLHVTSVSAQIAGLNVKAFPEGSTVTDEASSVALGALKLIRRRLKEEFPEGEDASAEPSG